MCENHWPDAFLKQLAKLVDCYRNRVVFLDQYDGSECKLLDPKIAEYCDGAQDLCEAITSAVASRTKAGTIFRVVDIKQRISPDDNCHSHQRRVPHDAYGCLNTRLQRAAEDIDAQKSFDGIFGIVSENAVHVHGVGKLMEYDVSLRIALWLENKQQREGVLPTTVYLHAGPLEAAKAIFKGRNPRSRPKSDFPEPLRKLSAVHLENFLCVYKSEIIEAARIYN